MATFELGQSVANFSASSTGGKTIELADYQGRYVILYFYPKDNTPGCTQEAQAFRDAYAELTALNAVVLGVSRDSVRVHEGFKCKQDLPFELLADEDESVCQLFDVIKLKNMYGREVRGIERSTFLIDPQQVLVGVWRKVKVKNHLQEVLSALVAAQA